MRKKQRHLAYFMLYFLPYQGGPNTGDNVNVSDITNVKQFSAIYVKKLIVFNCRQYSLITDYWMVYNVCS